MEIKTKYIPQENANVLVKVLEKAVELCPNVKFDVICDDEGDLIYHGKKIENVITEMDGMDCNFGVNCLDGEKVIGWFFFTPYEDEDEVICDHSDNEFCNQCVEV
jgi:hypothetical protein